MLFFFASKVLKDFKEAFVPQNIKAGVCISPCGVVNVPILALEVLDILLIFHLKLDKKFLAKYINGVSKIAIIILKKYVPKINVNNTVLKSSGSGFKIIQANIEKIVLSISDEIIVDILFLNHNNLFFINRIFS